MKVSATSQKKVRSFALISRSILRTTTWIFASAIRSPTSTFLKQLKTSSKKMVKRRKRLLLNRSQHPRWKFQRKKTTMSQPPCLMMSKNQKKLLQETVDTTPTPTSQHCVQNDAQPVLSAAVNRPNILTKRTPAFTACVYIQNLKRYEYETTVCPVD